VNSVYKWNLTAAINGRTPVRKRSLLVHAASRGDRNAEEVLGIVHHQHNEPANKKINVNYITQDEDENGWHKCLYIRKRKM
jgi:hypothetical protein